MGGYYSMLATRRVEDGWDIIQATRSVEDGGDIIQCELRGV